ncbi:DUF4194 domain-containing protein [Acidithiobacillus sp.]|uniref:DUF4194 domain-containing protein n=1 Tax=Acidithiobacillus sp. TaxID=1872118 RepID=UPI002633C439|nr:DUF4194 domain-containing protein [Acidithiobacillus sp.]MDD5279728.1 DUF4194 domain-containing protein [Acidithiobacillus sp.]
MNITQATPAAPPADLSVLLIGLLKGVLYRENDERQWAALLQLQARVRDYVGVLNLDLVLDEAEGYAFLKSRPEPTADDPSPRLPRLVARRPLSFAVSLLLALLRKKLAEFDAGGGDTRLVLSRDNIVDLVRVFLPDGPNEARLIDQIETTINKVVELGFLQKLKTASGATAGPANYEVRRILKAFVDAQWLAELDERLASYQEQLAGTTGSREETDHE